MRSAAVDDFLFHRPEAQRHVMNALREIIFASVKGVEESVKWNVPMYSHNGFLCYINFDRKFRKVTLAMVEGFLIADKYALFQHDTSNVKKILFDPDKDLPLRKIQYYLREGVRINQTKTKNFMSINKRRSA